MTRRYRARRKYNQEYLRDYLDSNEVHYVYALVHVASKSIGYFGVTNDPASREWQHRNDAKKEVSAWYKKFDTLPKLVILAICHSRDSAEIVERSLIRNFNDAGMHLSNAYKYENSRQRNKKAVLDDIPFWEITVDE